MRLLASAADALLDGRMPSDSARLFLAGALSAWLEHGGRCGALERDFLRVTPPKSSRHTAAVLLRKLAHADERQAGGEPSESGN